MKSPKILLLDSDRSFRETAVRLLGEDGLECELVKAVDAAIRRLSAESFDLVVCDLIADGVLVESVASMERQPDVMVLTDLSDADARVRHARSRGVAVLRRPIDEARFSRMVGWLLHGRRVRQACTGAPELVAMYRIAALANSEPSLAVFLDQMLATCLGSFGADSGSIMLMSAGAPPVLTVAASYGLEHLNDVEPVPVGQRISGWVAQQLRPVRLVGDASARPEFSGLSPRARVSESLVVPIVDRGVAKGVISIASAAPGRLGPEKLDLLIAAADIVASVLRRHRVELAQEHQNRLAVLGQLSANVAHELSNPLTVVKLNVDGVRQVLEERGLFDHSVASLLGDAADASNQMVGIIKGMKAFARKPTSELAPVELARVLQRAFAIVHPQFKVRVRLALEPNHRPLKVTGNEGRLLQVAINLIVNACQAVSHGGHVSVRSRQDGSWAVAEVEDDGPGIPQEVGDQIFEPFFTTKPEGEGTGLGLAIAKQIVVEHGGELTFASAVGRGTRFSLRLPVAADGFEQRRPIVLVVDDEPFLLRASERMLEPAFQVVTAASVGEALGKVDGPEVALAITDYNMPGKTGLDLVRALRGRGFTGPVVIVTADPDDASVVAALRAGEVNRVIGKPWSISAMAAEVSRLLSEHQASAGPSSPASPP